jgi:hypothetical protein
VQDPDNTAAPEVKLPYCDPSLMHEQWVLVSNETCVDKQFTLTHASLLQHNQGTFLATARMQHEAALRAYQQQSGAGRLLKCMYSHRCRYVSVFAW